LINRQNQKKISNRLEIYLRGGFSFTDWYNDVMNKQVGVVDCNNFFVSCERLFRPDLWRQPVAVLSSNDGCVVARSQEVKDMGIPMGVPYFQIKDIIKDNNIILFSSHIALYRDISRRVFLTLRELLDTVEQYSVDEAFFLVPPDKNPALLATAIKDKIEREVGVPVSVGIASSKTKAKYAVERAKKTTGIYVLSETTWLAQMERVALSELWGVGHNGFRRYHAAGYQTVADLLRADPARVKKLFGVNGERLRAELGPTRSYQVETRSAAPQSIMSSRSFKTETTDRSVVEDAIAYHTRHIAADLRAQRQLAMSVRISIRASKYSDFLLQGASLEAVLDRPSNDTFTLLSVTQNLLQAAFVAGVPYKKAGVSVAQLCSAEVEQLGLFTDSKQERNTLLQLVDQLNSKANRELILIGERKQSAVWQARRDCLSPAYTTNWTDVAEVKA
jgi:DNA polymerase V